MFSTPRVIRILLVGTAFASLTACDTVKNFDWDLRRGSALDTSDAARAATANRPSPDGRGVLSYPGYQVALARRGDTVSSVAARVGLDAAELASYNALKTDTVLREGEVLALPRRVADSGPAALGGSGAIIGGPVQTSGINVATIASGAIDNAQSQSQTKVIGQSAAAPAVAAPGGAEPVRHKVVRGETAFTIARSYNVTARALADWNGLDANMTVREGQYLMIPTAAPGKMRTVAVTSAPGQGSPTPLPPSASEPLPAKNETPATKAEKPAGTPASPDLGAQRTASSNSTFAMPVNGKIFRGYVKKKNDGIDISASAGTAVKAAADGSVAAITANTDGVPIVILRHADNLLTVYGGIDGLSVTKGATVKRGQTIAKIAAGNPAFLHFEVRKGFDSVDPMPYLQ